MVATMARKRKKPAGEDESPDQPAPKQKGHSVRLTDEHYAILSERAEVEVRSVANLVTIAIEHYLRSFPEARKPI